jgi:hypothetical protein
MAKKKGSQKFAIIKGRFKAAGSNIFGLFIAFVDKDLRMLDSAIGVVSSFSSLFAHDPAGSWKEIEDAIQIAKWEGNMIKNISNDLQMTLDQIRKDNSYQEELVEYVLSGSIKHIENFFIRLLEKILREKNIILEVDLEEATLSEIEKIRHDTLKKQVEERRDKSEDEGIQLKDGDVMIPVFHILNPVSGKPIMNIKPGEFIWIRIDSSTEQGEYFANLLGLKEEDKVKPVPAEVVKIARKKPTGYYIYVRIAPSVYGKAIEDASMVKLKMANDSLQPKEEQKSEIEDQKKTKSVDSPDKKGKSKLTFVLITVGILILILVIAFVLIML